MPRNPYKAIEDCNSSMKNSKYVEEKYRRNVDNIIPLKIDMWEMVVEILWENNVRSHDRKNGGRCLKDEKKGRSPFVVILSEFNKSFLCLGRRNTIGAFWGCWSQSCFFGGFWHLFIQLMISLVC